MTPESGRKPLYQEKWIIAKGLIRELEQQVQDQGTEINTLNQQLQDQAVTLTLMAPSKVVGDEIITFVKKVADTSSKFAKEARELLGR